jgi:hypothetical protein
VRPLQLAVETEARGTPPLTFRDNKEYEQPRGIRGALGAGAGRWGLVDGTAGKAGSKTGDSPGLGALHTAAWSGSRRGMYGTAKVRRVKKRAGISKKKKITENGVHTPRIFPLFVRDELHRRRQAVKGP